MIVKSQEAYDNGPQKEAQNPRAFPLAHNTNSRLGNSYTITPKRSHGFRPEGLPWLYQITRLLPASRLGGLIPILSKADLLGIPKSPAT